MSETHLLSPHTLLVRTSTESMSEDPIPKNPHTDDSFNTQEKENCFRCCKVWEIGNPTLMKLCWKFNVHTVFRCKYVVQAERIS